MPRQYEMTARSRAMEATRAAILDAAVSLFEESWYDEVTLGDVARRAGVSTQTVVNHFGSKVELYLKGLEERYVPALTADRARAVPGDVSSIVATVVRDYERTGDGTWRTILLAERVAELRKVIEGGRQAHLAWVETVCAPQLSRLRGSRRQRTARLLATVLDVTTWKALRRDAGLSSDDTADHLRTLVEAVLAA